MCVIQTVKDSFCLLIILPSLTSFVFYSAKAKHLPNLRAELKHASPSCMSDVLDLGFLPFSFSTTTQHLTIHNAFVYLK